VLSYITVNEVRLSTIYIVYFGKNNNSSSLSINKHEKHCFICVLGSNIPDCSLEISTVHNVCRAGCKRGFANDRNFSGNIFSSPGNNFILSLYCVSPKTSYFEKLVPKGSPVNNKINGV